MRKITTLSFALILMACGGSGGGGDKLLLAEKLFGKGIGTGQTPTHIVPREDGAGFEILSFGAWGNVYDIRQTIDNIDFPASGGWNTASSISNNNNIALYDFLGQTKLDVKENYKFIADASVTGATFIGPAVMYSWIYGGGVRNATDSDYGTMKLQFGEDIDSARLEFVMNNPSNNLITTYTGTCGSDKPCLKFTSDRENVAVTYRSPGSLSQGTEGKTYVGYGSKR